jgi:hypothetical protein
MVNGCMLNLFELMMLFALKALLVQVTSKRVTNMKLWRYSMPIMRCFVLVFSLLEFIMYLSINFGQVLQKKKLYLAHSANWT